MNYLRPELLDQLAAAYVLGTLRGAARRRFERLCLSSPAAQMVVRDWERKLSPLAAVVPAVNPPQHVWTKVAQRLGHSEAKASRSLWARWGSPSLSFAFGLVMAVGLLRFFPALLPTTPVAPPVAVSPNTGLPASYVGLLLDKHGVPTLLASSTRYGKTLTIKMLQAVSVPEGKAAAVWAIPKSGAPVLLGTMPTAGKPQIEMAGTSETLLADATQLGVTFEDARAVPSSPHGEIAFIGHCVKLW